MNTRTRFLAALLATSALVVAPAARAEQPAGAIGSPAREAPEAASLAAPARAEPPMDVNASGFFGLHSRGGAVAGAMATVRLGYFQLGVLGESGNTIFDEAHTTAAGVAGLSFRHLSGLRLDVLAVAGDHHYTGVSSGLLSDDPGASGHLPFAGARLGVSYVFGSGPVHFDLGLLAFAEDDLQHKSVSYTYQERDWFSPRTTTETAEHKIGEFRAGAALKLGVTFDL